MNRVTYRRLTKKDVAAVEELENECFSDPWTRAMLLGAFCSEFFVGFGAFSGKTLAGFAIGTSVFEDAETDDIAVRESFRRQGIGGELFTAFRRNGERAGRGARVFRSARIERGGDRAVRKPRVQKTARKKKVLPGRRRRVCDEQAAASRRSGGNAVGGTGSL